VASKKLRGEEVASKKLRGEEECSISERSALKVFKQDRRGIFSVRTILVENVQMLPLLIGTQNDCFG
jgi:hypothetical protein